MSRSPHRSAHHTAPFADTIPFALRYRSASPHPPVRAELVEARAVRLVRCVAQRRPPGWRCAASRIASRRRRREAQGFAAGRDSAPRDLTSRDCPSAAPAGRVASFARGCKGRASQRTPRAARGDGSGSPSLGYFSWRDKRSNSPAGARPGSSQLRPHFNQPNRTARALRQAQRERSWWHERFDTSARTGGWAGRALRQAQRERVGWGEAFRYLSANGRMGRAVLRHGAAGVIAA